MGRDDLLKFFKRNAAATNFDERADDGANHIAKKTVGCDFKTPRIVGKLIPTSVGECAKGRFHVGSSLAKRREIRLLEQPLGGFVHCLEVERIVHFARIIAQERVFARVYIIVVRARSGTESGVQVGSDWLDALHSDVARKKAIQTIDKLLTIKHLTAYQIGSRKRIFRKFIIEMHYHFSGVDTGIGAPCANGFDRLA